MTAVNRRTIRIALLVLLLATGLYPAPAHAANVFTKLGRGVANTATGWVELPASIGEKKREGTAVLWLVTGTVEGLIKAVTRTFYGVWDIVSCPIPPYDGPLLDPPTLATMDAWPPTYVFRVRQRMV